jgi:hypothetical protein
MLGSVVKNTFLSAGGSIAETDAERAPCRPAQIIACKEMSAPNQLKVLSQLGNGEGYGLDFFGHSR